MSGNKLGAKRRVAILAFLRQNAEENPEGPSPSIEEIREAVGLRSKGATAYQLRALRDLGLIEWTPGKSRSITIVEDAPDEGEPD